MEDQGKPKSATSHKLSETQVKVRATIHEVQTYSTFIIYFITSKISISYILWLYDKSNLIYFHSNWNHHWKNQLTSMMIFWHTYQTIRKRRTDGVRMKSRKSFTKKWSLLLISVSRSVSQKYLSNASITMLITDCGAITASLNK